MRVVVQRVSKASVSVEGEVVGEIDHGLLILLGIEDEDIKEDVEYLANKIVNMRIFNDKDGKMNASLLDVSGQILVVSQFTLHASTKKGNRPSFMRAARPEQAIPLYELFIETCFHLTSIKVEKGIFGANMQVSLTNNGPVTIILDSKLRE
jgi:D-aminoacyl-tRNA deacylase